MNVLVVGGSGGIGTALVAAFCARNDVSQVTATYHRARNLPTHPKLQWRELDLRCEDAIVRLLAALDSLDYLVNAAGLLHDRSGVPEKSIARLDPDFLLHSLQVNTVPTLLLARHAAPLLRTPRRSLFASISARVGSIGDNRLGGWYSYRCSKAALNMALKTLSIEWSRSLPNCVVAALHPGTTDTPLSKPFQRKVPPGKLFSPERSASYLMTVMDGLKPSDSGRFWSWDGSEIPW